MLFVVPVVLFDMLKAKQLACVSESGQKCPAARRSPYGERGLKFTSVILLYHVHMQSLSLRRAWIEIRTWLLEELKAKGRSPYGERGLK